MRRIPAGVIDRKRDRCGGLTVTTVTIQNYGHGGHGGLGQLNEMRLRIA
jgi:hypothetical protein